MTDTQTPPPTRQLSYGRPSRPPITLAASSIVLALIGFPLGAGTSMFLHTRPEWLSSPAAERAGFMLFAITEGLAAAAGCYGLIRARATTHPDAKPARVLATIGLILGGVGSAAVLMLVAVKAIQ